MELSVRALWVWAPVVLLMALIYFLSSLSEIPAPPGGMSPVSMPSSTVCLEYSCFELPPERGGRA